MKKYILWAIHDAMISIRKMRNYTRNHPKVTFTIGYILPEMIFKKHCSS